MFNKKGLKKMAFRRCDILLPKFSDNGEKMKQWSVVACDQYTSEPEYWKEVEQLTEGAYSTLRLTVPEIYLNDADIDERIKKTNETMDTYMAEDVFTEHKDAYIFVERTLRNGVKRLGVVGSVDLEERGCGSGVFYFAKVLAPTSSSAKHLHPLHVACLARLRENADDARGLACRAERFSEKGPRKRSRFCPDRDF